MGDHFGRARAPQSSTAFFVLVIGCLAEVSGVASEESRFGDVFRKLVACTVVQQFGEVVEGDRIPSGRDVCQGRNGRV